MPTLHTFAGAVYLMQILASAFLAILFLQSGIDKVVDRRGNLEWLKGHFAKSPLAGIVPAMVTAITILTEVQCSSIVPDIAVRGVTHGTPRVGVPLSLATSTRTCIALECELFYGAPRSFRTRG